MSSANTQMVYEVFQKVWPKPRDLINHRRYFIKEGDVVIFHSNKRRKVTRHLYLFNDRLLVTKRKGKSKYSDWLKIDVSLRVREVEIENMKTSSNNHEFRLHLPGRVSYIFYASTAEEKDAWCTDIDKSIKGEHEHDPKAKKKREKEQEKKDSDKKKEEESSEEEEAADPVRNSVFGLARDSQGSKIVINESDESSEEQEGLDDLKTHAQKVRSKVTTRTQSEVVSPTTKTKKQNAPLANHSLPATGNLIDWDPFAPHAASQPQLQLQPQNLAARVNKKNKRNKTSSTPVQDPKMKQSPLPYDPFLAPLSSSNPFNGNSSYPALMPNNVFTPSAPAPNPFAVQQSPINQPWPVNNSLGVQSNPSHFQPPVNNPFPPQSNSSPQLFFQSHSTQQNNSLGGSNPNLFPPQQNPFNVNTSAQVNQQNVQQQQNPFNVNTSGQVNQQQQLQQLQQQQLQQFQQQNQQQQLQQQQQKQQTGFSDNNPFGTPQGFYGGFQSQSTQVFGNSNF